MQCVLKAREQGLCFWGETDQHGTPSGHGNMYPKDYARHLIRFRELLVESLQKARAHIENGSA